MSNRFQNKKILVIEDEPAVLEILTERLCGEGMIVIPAKDGEQGFLFALRERPDLILLDIILPKLDGISFLKKLRKDPWGKTVEVIILTNLNDNNKVSDAITNGVHTFLIKSDWRLEDLMTVIKNKLK